MDELHRRVTEFLEYNPETGIFTWIKNKGRRKSGKVAGKVEKGYVSIKFDYKDYRAHRLAWFYVYKEFPSGALDHINRNKEDNRISNLRETSSIANCQNKDSKGYVFHKASNKWMARIMINYKDVYLGIFKTEEEAREAYVKAKRKYHPTWSENV